MDAKERARVRWRCRRGMLEMDVFILPFFDQCFDDLSEQEKRDFDKMLDCNDPQLFAWVMEQEVCEHSEFAYIVDKLIAFKPQLHR